MAVVRRKNAELAGLADTAAREAQRVLTNAKRALRVARKKAAGLAAVGQKDVVAGRRRGRLAGAVNDLSDLLEATGKIAAQTRERLAGVTPAGATRLTVCTIPTRGRSRRVASASRSSSATRPRSVTTPTASSSTTTSNPGTRPMHPG
jgi:hypothetical protein